VLEYRQRADGTQITSGASGTVLLDDQEDAPTARLTSGIQRESQIGCIDNPPENAGFLHHTQTA
jgi:hypothetical protein